MRTPRTVLHALVPPADAAQRRLLWALSFSALLHGLVLWPAPQPRPALPLAQPLIATLRPPSLPAPLAEAPAAVAAVAVHAAPASPRIDPAAKPEAAARIMKLTAERREKLPPPPAEVAAIAVTTVPSVSSAAVVSIPSASAESQAASSGASLAAGATVQEGVDGDALRQYRFAVVRRIGQPDFSELADELGSGRTAVVRVAIGQDGGVQSVTVARSSGSARVDAVAQNLISAGVRTTALPSALRGREFATEFPTQFRVDTRRRGDAWER